MKKSVLKFLSFVTVLKYPKVLKHHRYYIRDNFYSQLRQKKFFYSDYFNKKKYKIVEYYGEFQQELTYVLPFAYWHYLNGTLHKTISCKNTKQFYFFSDNHEEKYENRVSRFDYENYDIPNKTHSILKDFTKWTSIPFREHYKNNDFVFDKPILVIANKYNMEWDNPPINYFDLTTLKEIITCMEKRYKIVYNRPLSSHIVQDNSEIYDLNEFKWLQKHHPQVIIMNDMYEESKSIVQNFNHFQLMLYSNCTRFISVHGGTAALASYFGGINVILSDPKWSMENQFKEFDSVFTKLSGAKILHAKDCKEVVNHVKRFF